MTLANPNKGAQISHPNAYGKNSFVCTASSRLQISGVDSVVEVELGRFGAPRRQLHKVN